MFLLSRMKPRGKLSLLLVMAALAVVGAIGENGVSRLTFARRRAA